MRGALLGVWGVLLPFLPLFLGVQGGCTFDPIWRGKWFQSGVTNLVDITSSAISSKGLCVEQDGDKFLIEDTEYKCYRCVVIHGKHHNVLQYKETFCVPEDSLEHVCAEITGDASLYSMFRADAEPVDCPFQGPFNFTYNRGSGDCRSPVSRIDSCTEHSRLLLRYQACPDVTGTESTVERLVCLATWKEGSTRYLVGKLEHKMATTSEERYRCFVYEKSRDNSKTVYEVAQSGDATCNGLLSARDGSKVMVLSKENHSYKCAYPIWVTEHHKWHTLDGKMSYTFHKNGTGTFRIANHSDKSFKRVVCHSSEELSDKQVMFITHVTTGCESGYVCMMFYRRDGHVIEIQTGSLSPNMEEACHPMYFNATLPYITLITAKLKNRRCPYLGRYTVTGESHLGRVARDACDGLGVLVVGCSTTEQMEFHSSCSSESPTAYSCHGSWEDNGTNYLIASPVSRSSSGAHRFCFISTENDKMMHFSSITGSCLRNISPGINGMWAFNVTNLGQCTETQGNTASVVSSTPSTLAYSLVIVASFVLSTIR